MTDDTLTRLRAINPVTTEPEVPPISAIQARIAAGTAPPTGRPRRPARAATHHAVRRRRFAPRTVPIGGMAVAVAAVLVAVVGVGRNGRVMTPAPAPGTVTEAAAVAPAADHRGMRGLVTLSGAGLSGRGSGLISLWQCHCRQRQPQTAGWIARSTDDGASWSVYRSPFSFDYAPAFSGAGTIWGLSTSRSHLAAARGLFLPDGRIWVTHTGGRTWHWARLPGRAALHSGPVTIADGEVWGLAGACRPGCGHAVVHGTASGSALSATAAQPDPQQPSTMVLAAGRRTAYVEAGTALPMNLTSGAGDTHLYLTRDGGRSWQLTTEPCSTQLPSTELAVDGPQSLWEQCLTSSHSLTLARSTDGGRHWTTHPLSIPGGLTELRPVGGDTAWATTGGPRPALVRTSDGGATWRVVLQISTSAALMPAGPQSAAVDEILAHPATSQRPAASNLVVLRTADGGRHWHRTVVALPAG